MASGERTKPLLVNRSKLMFCPSTGKVESKREEPNSSFLWTLDAVREKCTELIHPVSFFEQAVHVIIMMRILESFGSLFFYGL